MIMNCTHCGAPIEANDEVCQYCGKLTAYGERMLDEHKREEQEEARRKALENLPTMKYVSMIFAVLMWVITIGGYSVYWYATRIAPLNALGTKKKFPAWAAAILAVSWFLMCFLPNTSDIPGVSPELMKEANSYAIGVLFVVSVYLAFAVRSMLQEYAAGFVEKPVAVSTVAPSGIMLILFGAIYLQHTVNRMISMKMLAPKI